MMDNDIEVLAYLTISARRKMIFLMEDFCVKKRGNIAIFIPAASTFVAGKRRWN